jgi:hypothetical protein
VALCRRSTTNQTTPVDRHTEVRTYWGRNLAEATALFQTDADELAANGYRPTSQVWTGPPSGVRIVLPPLILLIPAQLIFGIYGVAIAALIGIVYIVWMWTQARGTLNVTLTHGETPR